MQINILFSMRVKFYINISQSSQFIILNSLKVSKPLNHLLQAKTEYFKNYLQSAL